MQIESIPVNFSQGLDTKTDPKQVQLGRFLVLENAVFQKGGLLTKRNGYGQLSALPNNTYSYLTTLNNNLTAIGPTIAALNSSNETWITKGTFTPMQVGTLPLIRNSLNQTQCDSAVSPNGLVCTVYTEVNNSVPTIKYVIGDSTTGQNITTAQIIPVGSGTPTGSARVFLLGGYFIIVFTNLISASSFLEYIAISTSNVANVSANTTVDANAYTPATTVSWDGVVVGNSIYIGYNSLSGGQSIKIATFNANLSTPAIVSFTASTDKATILSMCADVSNQNIPVIYCSFYTSTTSNGYTLAVNKSLQTLMTPTQTITSVTVANIASAAQGGVCAIYSEVTNSYSYDNSIPSNYINGITCTLPATVTTGTVGSQYVVIRSLGLGSKAFIVNGIQYFVGSFQSPYQPTYFMINATQSTASAPNIVAKLAYENGGGYLTLGLPNAQVVGSIVTFPYLFKDFITAWNYQNNSQQLATPPVYSQTGINLATIDFTSIGIDSVDIAGSLNLSGGFLGMYDGSYPVEHNFFVWPDSLEVTTSASAVTPTGTVTSGSNVITAISSMVGIGIGASVTGTAIPGSTTIISISGSTATMSANATGTHTETITITGNINIAQQYYYQAIYQWTDNNGNQYYSAPSIPFSQTTTGTTSTNTITLPTLRLTMKTSSPVKIVLYRWSAAQEVYYQITSVTAPLLNSTTVDSVTFYDSQGDAGILGNSIIYTNGGVVEDINGPASNIMTLFDTRLWLVDSEDQNLLWYSKQVIEAVPVEMSDLFTFYVAPNTGTVSSTGVIGALAPMDDKLIIFKSGGAIYYINGSGPDNTGANSQYSQPIFITSSVGTNIQNSIVLTPDGLQFKSDKGIWLLGRDLSTKYIGAPVEAFNSSAVTSAVNVPSTTQIRYTLSTGQTLMYDYYYNQWGTFAGVPAISSCIYNGLHTFINKYGAVYQETPGIYLDGSSPVLLAFKTGNIQTQGLSGFQRFIEFQILGDYISPHLLNTQIGYDYGSFSEQVTIQPTNATGVFGSDQLFGQTSTFGGHGSLEQWRIQPSQQRCQSFQLSIKEIYDPSMGVAAGAGFTMSTMTLVIGALRGYRPVKAANTVGTT